ncbi:alpha/beta hydrolase [Nocardia flavorosea]|uniref:Alpha/beta hydrolase n=1 Tax=Nocardia flavorosea TaxID=53429 RepID=A0A846YDN7_9NOCA|nr:alpha/beta hydrolase fold domain-containing protein [Nocardia flavorosea]NKY54909.1 alpha/beta hydrolase [Nocardia flavorosea]
MTAPPVRGSWQARAVRQVSALTARRLAAAAPVNACTLPFARALIDQALRTVAPALSGTTVEQVRDGRVRGEWVRGPRAGRTDAVVLYVHGGGFVAGSAAGYRGVASRLSTATGLPVFTLDYRRAPEHPYPAAPQDIDHAFRWLTGRGYAPGRILVAGDSAGGFLAADFVIDRARSGLPAPSGVVLFSPMADLSLGVATGYEGARTCGLLSAGLSRRAVTHFTPDPYELLPAPGKTLPPALIHAGDTEFFGGDALVLAQRWTATGAVCDLQIWPDQIHAFQVLPVLIPESRLAYRSAARFAAAVLEPTAAAV